MNIPWTALNYLIASCVAVTMAASIPHPTQAQLVALDLVSAVAIGSVALQVPLGIKFLPATLKAVAVLGASAIGFQAPSHVGPIVRAVFYTSLQQKMSAGPSATDRNTDACRPFASGKVTSAAFSPDGTRIVTASADGTARLWDARTGEPIGKTLRQDGPVRAATFDATGERVVTASDDKTARIWDARTGEPIGRTLHHDGPVLAATFDANGERVITASEDKTARIWNARTGEPVGQPLQHNGSVTSAAFSPDGTRIVTASADGTARLWDARTGAAISQPAAPGWASALSQCNPQKS